MTYAASPSLIEVMSDSNTSATIQMRLRSVIVYRSLSGVTFWFGNALRSVTKPLVGAMTR